MLHYISQTFHLFNTNKMIAIEIAWQKVCTYFCCKKIK
jgi:hypothetical protein